MTNTHSLQTKVRPAQQGIVLIVVLVLLVAVTFMSVSVMRGALNTDVMANNARTQTLAAEMAQLALRFCEDDLRKAPSERVLFKDSPDIQPRAATEAAMAWKLKTNWVSSTPVAKTLSTAQLASTNSAFSPTHRPQCLAESSPSSSTDTGTDRIIVVTARGFSPDYNEDNSNNVTSGSVAWLQSRFVLSN